MIPTDRMLLVVGLSSPELGRKTGMPLSGFGKPITGDIQFLCMDALILDDTEVRNRPPSEIPDLASDLCKKTGTPLSGFSKPITGNIHSKHTGELIADDT